MDNDFPWVSSGGTVPVPQTDGRRAHGDAPPLLLFKAVQVAKGAGVPLGNDTIRLDKGVGQSRLAMVDVRNNG